MAYPVFLAGRLLGPNATVRRWIGDLEKRVHAELGRPALREQAMSVVAVGAALWTGLTLKLDLFQHPKLIRTMYRMPTERWTGFHLWEEIQRKTSLPNLSVQVELRHAKQQVWLRLEGALSSAEAEGLGQRIHDSLARSKSRLVLDLNRLQWDKVGDLRPHPGKASCLSLAHPAHPSAVGCHSPRGDPPREHVRTLQRLKGWQRPEAARPIVVFVIRLDHPRRKCQAWSHD